MRVELQETTGSINGQTYREVDWNIVVADEVAKILGERGIHFTRVGADIPFTNAEIAVAIHFDGSIVDALQVHLLDIVQLTIRLKERH